MCPDNGANMKQTEVTPTPRTNGLISATRDLDESVYRETQLFLRDQAIVDASERLPTAFACCRVNRDYALKPVMVRVLAHRVEILRARHHRYSSNGVVLKAWADAAGVRHFEFPRDVLV